MFSYVLYVLKDLLVCMYVCMYVCMCVLDTTIKGGERSAVFRASRPKKSASGREASEVTAARSKSAFRGRVGRPSSGSGSGSSGSNSRKASPSSGGPRSRARG